jgi:outer membrane protein
MKFFISLSFLLLFVFNPINSNEIKIVYVDTDKILNESNVGKNIKKQVDVINDKNISNFKKTEEKLKAEEKKISQQKNIISKEEFEKKFNVLRINANKFNKDVNDSKNDLMLKKNIAIKKLLDNLTPILSEYALKNSIHIILQKSHIIIGREDLDITDSILTIVNKRVKNIKLN